MARFERGTLNGFLGSGFHWKMVNRKSINTVISRIISATSVVHSKISRPGNCIFIIHPAVILSIHLVKWNFWRVIKQVFTEEIYIRSDRRTGGKSLFTRLEHPIKKMQSA